MKMVVVGHSMIHIRQQKFFQAVSRVGDLEVVVISPGEWNGQRTLSREEGGFRLKTLRHTKPVEGENIYAYELLGLEDFLRQESPDVVYVHAEPGSLLAGRVASYEGNWRKVLFTWENVESNFTPYSIGILPYYDKIVCGNGEGQKIVRRHHRKSVVLPQVGVDLEHFAEREVTRNISVAYFGRVTEEKGVKQLALAWPTAEVVKWKDYLELPWWYSMAKIVVCFSQDTEYWKEQAMPYVAMEALSCGALPIVSDAGSIPYWLNGGYASPCPGVWIVPSHSTGLLKQAISSALGDEKQRAQMVAEGREWLRAVLSTETVAKRVAQEVAYDK